MKFVIRDDDLNYFSKPADITRWYDEIFALGVPVAFAAIPFVKQSSDVYPFLLPETAPTLEVKDKDVDKEFPIGDNAELVSYIKSNAQIEVLQHGCTHAIVNGTFEYAQKGVNLKKDSCRGREELERAFGESFTPLFAAPHDWINSNGVRGIEAAKLDIIRGRGAGLRNWLWRWQYAVIFLRMLFFRYPKYISTAPPVYPYVLDFGKHKEVCSYRLEDPDLFEGLKYAHDKDGVFVVVAHVHFYTDEKKARLLKLIDEARKLGAEFVVPSSVFAKK